MLKNIANHFGNHSLQRHLIFLGLAILSTLINGYHFGTFDQVFHITFLRKFINPNLYPNDPFLNLRYYHFSYFWFPFISLFKAGILEISMFVIHILTVYGTFWMFWALSDLLFSSNGANFLLLLALIFPHLGLPGFQIIEFSLLNRTFVLPFLLGSIWLYLKGRKQLAFMLLGFMLNLHVIYAVFVLCMFLLNEALTFTWKAWWKPIAQMSIFTIAGLPVLIWRMQTGSGIDLSLRPETLDLATRGLLYTVYYPVGLNRYVIGNFIAGIGTVLGFFLGFRVTPKTGKHLVMRNFVLAIGVLFLVAVITSYLLPVTILLQMQLLRVGVFMLYISMIYLSFFLYNQRENGQLNPGSFAMLGVSFVILVTPLITILLWIITKPLKRTRFKPVWLIPFVLAIQALTILFSLQTGLWVPGFHIYGPDSQWREIQEWARKNTPIEAMFITPPHLFGHYIPDWRVFSERATIATIPELMEIPFAPDFSESFQQRFEAVAPGAIEAFNGNYMVSIGITEDAFYANSDAEFSALACQFSADYLVVERDHPYDFNIEYQNDGFIMYTLPSCP